MLTADDFTALLHQDLKPAEDGTTLTLTAIERGRPDRQREPFSLLLRGPRAPMLPEGQYEFELQGAGRVSLYVIPVHTPATTHQDYQVVFN